jgi:catechol-2,3-dioxygenase
VFFVCIPTCPLIPGRLVTEEEMHITRLELHGSDLEQQALFYREVLALDVHIEEGIRLTVHAGTTEVIFSKAEVGESSLYHFAFDIPENQFEHAKEWLASRTALLANEDGSTTTYSKTWNSHSVYFKDAAGNILELIARHALQNASEGYKILSVSEIGLATEDVLALVKTLKEKTGLSPYKDESSETFTAVGDANGLFITVKQGRIWYPNTGVPAQLLPIRVHFLVDETKMSLGGFPYQIDLVK